MLKDVYSFNVALNDSNIFRANLSYSYYVFLFVQTYILSKNQSMYFYLISFNFSMTFYGHGRNLVHLLITTTHSTLFIVFNKL